MVASGILLVVFHPVQSQRLVAAVTSTALRVALCAQATAYTAIPRLHFVAVAIGKMTVPKAGLLSRGPDGWGRIRLAQRQITYRSRYAFWGDVARFRIDYSQSETSLGSIVESEAWNLNLFQVFEPMGRILHVWPALPKPKQFVDMMPLNPILIPLEFTQPPGLPLKGLPRLSFARMHGHLKSVLARCNAVKLLRPPHGGKGLWGVVKGSFRSLPATYEMRVSEKPPHLVVALRVKVSEFAWSSKKITYAQFRVGGRAIWLPRKITSVGKGSGTLVQNFRRTDVATRFSPSIYTINFKQARLVVKGPSGKVVNAGPVK